MCALYKGDVEIPSDYDGVVFIKHDKGDGWKFISLQKRSSTPALKLT